MRGWAKLGDGLAVLSTLLIAALMVLICADAFARNIFGGSLPLVSELGASLLVVIVYLALATTIRHNRLARTDVFMAWLAAERPRAAALLSAVYDLIGAVLLALIGWAGVLTLARDFAGGKYLGIQGVLTFPLWPFGAAFVIGLAVACIQFLLQALHALRGGAARIGGGLE
ncbi:MAG: TRAP transporter small permease [Cypionkella sp.]|jgi:TRAP-type C4-dicarboxylate transport system permease small subunit|nr:TRAP transporter small permease [Cypionkella sp.]